MGFENASFDGWTGEVVRRDNNNITPQLLQHCIMTSTMRDPFIAPANLPVVPPGGSYSLRLGNSAAGGHIARIRKTFRVDSSNMLFTYRYAVVLEDPAGSNGHDGLDSPHFQARLITPDGTSIDCAEYAIVVSSNLQSYSRVCIQADNDDDNNDDINNSNTEVDNERINIGCPSGAPGSNTNLTPIITSSSVPVPGSTCARGGGGGGNDWMDLYYRSWSAVTVVLNQYLGQLVTIEFSAADCEPGGHLGYAYVAAECNRLNLALPGFICSGKETKLVNAPPGFASYAWTTSNGGVIQGAANGQFITITHAGTYRVSVVPFTTASSTCPYEITYVVQNRCPLSDTLCETIKGSGMAAQIDLTSYNSLITGSVSTSLVESWHAGLPISNVNKIADPTSANIGSGTYYAFITDPVIKNDTVGLTFAILSKPTAIFDDIPLLCLGSPPYSINNASPIGGIFSGTNVSTNGIFSPSVVGSFDIVYKVTNQGGCTDSVTKKATVGTISKVEAMGDTMVCYKGEAISLPLRSTATSTDSVIWTSPVGTISGDALANTALQVSGPAPFDRDFYAVVSLYSKVCPISKDSIRIRTRQLPSVIAPTDELLCSNGGTESFNLRGQVAYEDSLRWDANTASWSNRFSENPVLRLSTVYPDSSVTKIILFALKEACPVVKDSLVVRILPFPSVTAANDTSYCTNQSSFLLRANAMGQISTLWQAKNMTGQISRPNSLSSPFIPQSIVSSTQGMFVISAFSKQCGVAKDSFSVNIIASKRVRASTQATCLVDRRVMLTGLALAGTDRTPASWKSSGGGNFLLHPDSLTNAYIPSSQDISSGSVVLTLEPKGPSSRCPSTDTSFIWKIEPLPNLAVPTPIGCENSLVRLEANQIPKSTYFWGNTTGSPLNTFTTNIGNKPSLLKVRVIDAFGCQDSMIVSLNPFPYPLFRLSGTPICPGQTGTIVTTLSDLALARDPSFGFQWKNGTRIISSSTWQNLVLGKGGNYALSLSYKGCVKSDSVTVLDQPAPKIEMPLEYIHCIETDPPILLSPLVFDQYLWLYENGTTDATASISVSPTKTTQYGLVVSNQFACKDTAQILVKSSCPPRLFVPNVITPQSNDVNASLQIFGAHYTNFEITIFSRWGEIIFNTKDPQNAWDGIYKLENMPIGTYPWLVTYEGDTERYRGPYKKTGEVTIVR